jgi:hypothetical protein
VQSQLQSIKEKSWTVEEIYITSSNKIKYDTYTTLADIKAVDPDYLTNDIINGIWSEPLPSLEDGDCMFKNCSQLTSFNADLSSLTDGSAMFSSCSELTSFNSDLSSLTTGDEMFYSCDELKSFDSNLSSLVNGYRMFASCDNLTTFNCDDLKSLKSGY